MRLPTIAMCAVSLLGSSFAARAGDDCDAVMQILESGKDGFAAYRGPIDTPRYPDPKRLGQWHGNVLPGMSGCSVYEFADRFEFGCQSSATSEGDIKKQGKDYIRDLFVNCFDHRNWSFKERTFTVGSTRTTRSEIVSKDMRLGLTADSGFETALGDRSLFLNYFSQK